ncbi:hypothetical protein BCR34DRAFT_651908, partial [Clohesyomyces aquaticus]
EGAGGATAQGLVEPPLAASRSSPADHWSWALGAGFCMCNSHPASQSWALCLSAAADGTEQTPRAAELVGASSPSLPAAAGACWGAEPPGVPHPVAAKSCSSTNKVPSTPQLACQSSHAVQHIHGLLCVPAGLCRWPGGRITTSTPMGSSAAADFSTKDAATREFTARRRTREPPTPPGSRHARGFAPDGLLCSYPRLPQSLPLSETATAAVYTLAFRSIEHRAPNVALLVARRLDNSFDMLYDTNSSTFARPDPYCCQQFEGARK